MGGVISASTKLADNELLKKFSGLQPITDNDPFWNQLLSFNMKIDLTNRYVWLIEIFHDCYLEENRNILKNH